MEGMGAIVKFKPEITFNTNRYAKNGKKLPDGIEIRFGKNKPTEAVRELLKAQGFQWSEKQRMWYAYQTDTSKAFVDDFARQEVEVDDTQYEKLHFWAKIKSHKEYGQLNPYTTFAYEGTFYSTKKALEKKVSVAQAIREGKLSFKKFYSKALETGDVQHDQEPAEPVSATEPTSKLSADHAKELAEKFRRMAEGMQKAIAGKIHSATSQQRPTARRNRIASGMRQEGYRLQEIQQALYALAHGYENHSSALTSRILEKVRTKEDVRRVLFYSLRESPWHGYNSFNQEEWGKFCEQEWQRNQQEYAKLGIAGVYDMATASVLMGELIGEYRNEKGTTQQVAPAFDPKQAQLKELENKLFGQKIPGFFPTPPDLTERVVALADLEAHHTVLEPSAGKGDLAEAVRNHCPACRLECIEINAQLREILELKGFTLLPERDFLAVTPSEKYDRIVMNPPFEDGQDVDHVLHAYKLIKPGGRVVAIMSEGPFFRQYKKDVAFREFLADHKAYLSAPFRDAFKNAFNSTGITIRIVSLVKPAVSTAPAANEAEEMELLELEAQAEIEILQLRVELAKKGKGLNGVNSHHQLERMAISIENHL